MLLSSTIRSAFATLAIVFLVASTHGELPPGADIDLFGDGLVRPIPGQGPGADSTETALPKSDLCPHTLILQGVGELRGKLLSIEDAVAVWQIPGTSSPIRIPTLDLRKIVLDAVDLTAFASDDMDLLVEPVDGIDPGELATSPFPPLHSTVKLAGGDWLFGNVTSRDGKRFEVELAGHATIPFDRPGIRWIAFGRRPAPALEFSAADPAGLSSWKERPVGVTAAAEGATLRFDDGHWISAGLREPKRFEVSMEVPEAKEEAINIAIQPLGMDAPNTFTTGSMTFRLGSRDLEHTVFINGNFNQGTTRVMGKESDGSGASKYRLLYDGIRERLVILRNGHKEEDMSFRDRLKNDALTLPIPSPGGIIIYPCGPHPNLALNSLRVEPWSGVVPEQADVPIEGDTLTKDSQPPAAGRLGSIASESLRFNGREMPLEENMVVRLTSAPPSLAKVVCTASLGDSGELKLAAVNVANGRLAGHVAYGSCDIPLAAVKTLTFSQLGAPLNPPTKAAAAPQFLIFKNGGRLPGTLLKSESGRPLVWQTESKQVLEIGAGQVAGVLLARAASKPAPAAAAASGSGASQQISLLELRNGDRLRGNLTGMDEAAFTYNNDFIGPRSISRAAFWRLSLKATAIPEGNFPIANMYRFDAKSSQRTVGALSESWIYLDGCYLAGSADSDNILALSPEWLPERFDFSFDVTSTRPDGAGFQLKVLGSDGDSFVFVSEAYQNVNVNVHLPNVHRNIVKQISTDAVGKTTRSRVRVLADRACGLMQIAIDGAKVFESSRQNNSEIPGLGKAILFGSGSFGQAVVSNIQLVPWSGELPPSAYAAASTILNNGDAVVGPIQAVSDGNLSAESELGPVQIPLQQVALIQGSGDFAPAPCAARIWLADGSVLHLDSFRWDGQTLSGKSTVLGDIRLQEAAVAELILSPALAREPLRVQSKRTSAAKDAKARTGAADAKAPM